MKKLFSILFVAVALLFSAASVEAKIFHFEINGVPHASIDGKPAFEVLADYHAKFKKQSPQEKIEPQQASKKATQIKMAAPQIAQTRAYAPVREAKEVQIIEPKTAKSNRGAYIASQPKAEKQAVASNSPAKKYYATKNSEVQNVPVRDSGSESKYSNNSLANQHYATAVPEKELGSRAQNKAPGLKDSRSNNSPAKKVDAKKEGLLVGWDVREEIRNKRGDILVEKRRANLNGEYLLQEYYAPGYNEKNLPAEKYTQKYARYMHVDTGEKPVKPGTEVTYVIDDSGMPSKLAMDHIVNENKADYEIVDQAEGRFIKLEKPQGVTIRYLHGNDMIVRQGPVMPTKELYAYTEANSLTPEQAREKHAAQNTVAAKNKT
jgi:hypothetical protein